MTATAGPNLRQWIEISPAAYRQNLQVFRQELGPRPLIMAVVKANAYGHGARLIAPLAAEAGAAYLGVDTLAEFEEIRDLCGALPVCLLGASLAEEAAAVVAAGVEPTVSSLAVARALAAAARAGRGVNVHLKIETGTHRQGIPPGEIPAWCRLLDEQPCLHLRGLHTHFANIEDTTDHTIARRQLARFAEAREAFAAQGHVPDLCHSACSAAAIVMPQTWEDLVRLGIASYGLWPSRETLLAARFSERSTPDLTAVLAWKTRLAQIRMVPPGEYVGYGCTFRTTRTMRLAVLPVGYYDGFDRRLSGRGHVLLRGRRAPVVGRICMNMTMIDISDMPQAALGEEVTLLGRSGDEVITVDSLAAICGTISYEIVSRLGRHIPRRLVAED